MRALADSNLIVTKMMGFVVEMVGNIVGKGEYACFRVFFFFTFSSMFQECFHCILGIVCLTLSQTIPTFYDPEKAAF